MSNSQQKADIIAAYHQKDIILCLAGSSSSSPLCIFILLLLFFAQRTQPSQISDWSVRKLREKNDFFFNFSSVLDIPFMAK